MCCGRKSGYVEYMQMAQNFSCRPLLKQLSGRHQLLLLARIGPFVYGSREQIFILLFHVGFTWIPHALSIIEEETRHLQNIIKTFYRVIVFPCGCCSCIYSMSFLHITGSNILIKVARA